MNFYLVPGDNEHPLTHIAVSRDGSRCLAGTAAGTLLSYGLDGNPPEELPLPRKYASIAGLAFEGAGNDALAIGMTAPATGDVLRVLDASRTQISYESAPFPFGGIVISPDGSFGLLAGGGELLRWYPEQRSYLPVDTPAGLLVSAMALGPDGNGVVAGGAPAGGFLARYLAKPQPGQLQMFEANGFPAFGAAGCDPASGRALAGGKPGGLALLDGSAAPRLLPGPKNAVVRSIAFHPAEGWALLACGLAGASDKGAELLRFDPTDGKLTHLYEGPPGAGAFLSAAWLPDGGRAVIATEWGQILEMTA